MNPIPALVMFVLTAAVVAAFLIPATHSRRSALLNFYWVGAWLFLALLAAVSGGEQVVRFLGLDASNFAARLQAALLVCFPIFIVAAWLRLVGVALVRGAARLTR